MIFLLGYFMSLSVNNKTIHQLLGYIRNNEITKTDWQSVCLSLIV
jgi:hypothetical protein